MYFIIITDKKNKRITAKSYTYRTYKDSVKGKKKQENRKTLILAKIPCRITVVNIEL